MPCPDAQSHSFDTLRLPEERKAGPPGAWGIQTVEARYWALMLHRLSPAVFCAHSNKRLIILATLVEARKRAKIGKRMDRKNQRSPLPAWLFPG